MESQPTHLTQVLPGSALRQLILITAVASSFGSAAHATLVAAPPPFNSSDFSVIEGQGVYTVVNNSSDWSVFRFVVQNAEAATGSAHTTQLGWTPSTVSFAPFVQRFERLD